MSPKRIAAASGVAAVFLSLGLGAFWYCSFPAEWIPAALFIFGGGIALVIVELQTQRMLRSRYWQRRCTGASWKRRFPNSSKIEIREFLTVLVDAFGFARNKRCCFSPDDKITAVYRTLYPIKGEPDGMELEDFYGNLEKLYAIGLVAICREDMTLGEIYRRTRRLEG